LLIQVSLPTPTLLHSIKPSAQTQEERREGIPSNLDDLLGAAETGEEDANDVSKPKALGQRRTVDEFKVGGGASQGAGGPECWWPPRWVLCLLLALGALVVWTGTPSDDVKRPAPRTPLLTQAGYYQLFPPGAKIIQKAPRQRRMADFEVGGPGCQGARGPEGIRVVVAICFFVFVALRALPV